MNLKIVYFIIICVLLSINAGASEVDYRTVPLPHEIGFQNKKPFVLDSNIKIIYPHDNLLMCNNAKYLATYLTDVIGSHIAIDSPEWIKKRIILSLDEGVGNSEGYCIFVSKNIIKISAATEAGIFYGIQTLRKSLPIKAVAKVVLPAVIIKDYPRFPYRGVMLDVSRHFTEVEDMKTFIDMLALHNVNYLHLHLTDDQGWRIEIKKYPLLTEIGSRRSETVIGKNTGIYDGIPYKKFYTKAEMQAIVSYAKERYITIIPEIDLPGHLQAALAAYPELGCTGGPYNVWTKWGISDEVLCAGNDAGLVFIEDVLTEIAEIFPAEYVHIGGDECHKTRWKVCDKCQNKIKSLGFEDTNNFTAEEMLQSHITSYAESILQKLGKKMIGWEEIMQGGLSKNATIMSWRAKGSEIKAAKNGNKVIMTSKSHLYFDYYQSKEINREPFAIGGYVPIEQVYSFNPIPIELTTEESEFIIGVQANVWTEYMPTFNHLQYMILPRLAALSEVQWLQSEKINYDDFKLRIPQMIKQYSQLGYNFRKTSS